MKITHRERNGNNALGRFTVYAFDTGHYFRQWDNGHYFAYTPKGNFTSQPTAHKLIRIISEYESNRQQIPD